MLRSLTRVALMLGALVTMSAGAGAFDRHGDGGSYARYHMHHNHCGVYAAETRHRRPHVYPLDVKPGRYVWRHVRIRVGTLRQGRREIPQYRTVRKRVLVRPVRYRLRKRHAHTRPVGRPVVIEGRARFPHRSRC
ncbi:MAG: hypothetical protein AAFQ42_12815 [Pseudomonadota bacterium]